MAALYHTPASLAHAAVHGKAHFLFSASHGLNLPKLESRSIGLLCLAITSIGWGVNWPAMKFLLREWPPLFARGSAGVIAAIVIACIAAMCGQSLRVPRAQIGRLLVSAFINVIAWMGFTTLSLRWLQAGQAALLVYTMPVWATLLAWPFLGKRPGAASLCGLALCIGGVGLLFGGGELALGIDKLPGVLFALGAAILFALGTVAVAPLALPPLTTVAWQLALGCAPMLAYGLLVEKPDFSAITPAGMGVMTYMTIVPMGVCYMTWFAALRRLPPATASVATLLTPVVGVCAAALALGEPLGAREFAAMGLTLAGIALALRKA
ncbi:DMT family transporter [Noviherbaspirillum sedimenti]|uniref:DMT family transporter n=2 Tax=Noviherbaspirillum sedimenti TaxID=2320865 RepID=A0A3A3GPZ3_9BURK|nr:DMT family transporter [Noviherbaspirillum sedimenti]